MEAKAGHKIKPITPYRYMFPVANATEKTVKSNADVSDTVSFIPKVVAKTKWQVREFVNTMLRNLPLEEACERLWHFVKDHIRYEKDQSGKEQVRSPRRLVHDAKGDCDCYTVFISCCLSELSQKMKIIHRITKYSKDFFQHIYPVVVLPSGKTIIMDCVTNHYNYQEPFTEKQDYPMELNYLDGIPSKTNLDSEQLYDESGLSELGALFKKKTGEPKTKLGQKLQKVGEKIKDAGQKVKEVASKTIHAINRVNPVTVVLRNGLLAAMKLNMMKVSQRIKYSYLSEQEAQKRGIDMNKYQKLKEIRTKLEKIFHGAGGKPENLKAAILTGKGNANKEVNGLGYIPSSSVEQMSIHTPLEKLLGEEIYRSENTEGNEPIEGLGELGEPVTAASVTAASGVLAAIAALLKNIGNIFKAKEKGSEDFENTADADQEASQTTASDLDNFTIPEDFEMTSRSAMETDVQESTPGTSDKAGDPNAQGTWWERNKKWAKPTAWITGLLSVAGISYGVYKSSQKNSDNKKSKSKAMSGTPKSKPKTKRKKKSKKGKITPVTLM